PGRRLASRPSPRWCCPTISTTRIPTLPAPPTSARRPSTDAARPSVGDQPVAGELLGRLFERDVGGREGQVRGQQVVVGGLAPGGADVAEQLAPLRGDRVLVACLDRRHDGVVDFVELRGVCVVDRVLPFPRNANDHCWAPSCGAAGGGSVAVAPPGAASAG